MDTNPVVEQDVLRNSVPSFLPGSKMKPFHPFRLDGLEERLRTGIVVGCARAAHALDAADGGDLASEIP